MKDKLNNILANLEKRISKLELILKVSSPTDKTKSGRKRNNKKTLSDHIIELRDRKFFSTPKVAEEVHKALTISYACDFARVKVALLRLRKRKQLRKATKLIEGKKYVAYAW